MKDNKKKTQAYALRERTIELIEWAAGCAGCSRSVIVQDALDMYFDLIRRVSRNGKTRSDSEESWGE